MDEQKKYEVIKGLADHPESSKERAALSLGCTVRHVNRMLAGYKASGKTYFFCLRGGFMAEATTSSMAGSSTACCNMLPLQ